MEKTYEILKGQEEGPVVVYRCPECGRRIESRLCDAGTRERCPACGEMTSVPGEAEWALVEEAEREAEARMDEDGEFTVIWTAQSAIEAQIAIGALQEAGIPLLSEDFARNPYDGALATQFGWGRIFVREDDAARAKELIEEALKPCPIEESETADDNEPETEPE